MAAETRWQPADVSSSSPTTVAFDSACSEFLSLHEKCSILSNKKKKEPVQVSYTASDRHSTILV